MSEQEQSAYERLNDQQRAFVDAYLETLCATKAARAAKYGPPHNRVGWRLRHEPDVAEAISVELDKRLMPKGEVLERIAMIARDPKAHAKDKLKALELTAKVGGYLKERVDLTSNDEQLGGVVFYLPDNGRDTPADHHPAATGPAGDVPL